MAKYQVAYLISDEAESKYGLRVNISVDADTSLTMDALVAQIEWRLWDMARYWAKNEGVVVEISEYRSGAWKEK